MRDVQTSPCGRVKSAQPMRLREPHGVQQQAVDDGAEAQDEDHGGSEPQQPAQDGSGPGRCRGRTAPPAGAVADLA